MNIPASVRLGVVALTLLLSNVGKAATMAQLKQVFKEPPREFSTGPLWVWNDMLTEQQVRSTIRDMAAQHVKQVWVHPRPGLMTPYLSEEWFKLWRIALQEAERLDMNVWIYDENSYPSGFAGGLVPELMPESRGRGLVLKEVNGSPKWETNTVAVFRLDGTVAEDVSAIVRTSPAPKGKYLVAQEVRAGNSPWHGNRCYVNLLSPGVTEKFLQLTLEPYRREVGEQFGKRIPGVFTDEPNIRPAGGFPWSEILVDEFKKRWGYDLVSNLPSLASKTGDWRKVRHDYFKLLNEQFIEHWAKPYFYYCETNKLQFTGHYWDHEWPNCMGVPDNMAMYAYHQLPAIDCLMNQYAEHTHAQFGNVRMVKELSSVANQLGRKHTLCEIYGAGGWDLRFEDMKRIGDWLEVLGVNVLNQHLSYVTIRGARKRDHPQSFSYHAPWWDAYHVSADYFARLSAALSQGRQVNRVLIIQPTTTAWMHQDDDARLKQIGNSFFELLMSLERAQVEYDIGCEDILQKYGSIRPAGFARTVPSTSGAQVIKTAAEVELAVGDASYDVVVIPPGSETLNKSTADLLLELTKSATAPRVICLGEVPKLVEGRESTALSAATNRPGWKVLSSEQLPDVQQLRTGTRGFTLRREPGDRGILFHHRRELEDCDVLLLVNTSLEHATRGRFDTVMRSIQTLDPYSGDVRLYPFRKTSSGISADFVIPPSGSLLLSLGREPGKTFTQPTEQVTTVEPSGDMECTRLEPNVLTLDFVDVTAGDETRTNQYFYPANQFVWKRNGMDRDPWDSAVQFRDELITKQFPQGSGFEASYRFILDRQIPSDLAIVIERPDLYEVTCNGQPLKWDGRTWWLDRSFGKLSLSEHAKVGENTVTIKATPFTMLHELEPAYLLGNFNLVSSSRGFEVAPAAAVQPGVAWNAQGMPFYSAGVNYRERFDLRTKRPGQYFVCLPKWYGSVAKVTVNGHPAGYVDAPPWEIDVSKWVKSGENQVDITVIGTPKNLLGPHHGNPGLGAAWPGNFQRGPEGGLQPAGEKYSTVGYGLFEPFVLKHKTTKPANATTASVGRAIDQP